MLKKVKFSSPKEFTNQIVLVNFSFAPGTLKKHSLEDYLKNEIYPDLSLMNKEFGVIKSFSYPFGSRNEIIDRYLFDQFKIIRGTVYSRNKRLFFKKTIKMLDKIFISSDKEMLAIFSKSLDFSGISVFLFN